MPTKTIDGCGCCGGSTTSGGCPCDGELDVTNSFTMDTEISNGNCTECAGLNDLNLTFVDSCTFLTGSTSCGFYLSEDVSITLFFDTDGSGNLVVTLEFRTATTGTLMAEYEKTYSGEPTCDQVHTLNKVSGDSTCSWPTTYQVTPI